MIFIFLPSRANSHDKTAVTSIVYIPAQEIDVLYDLAMKGELPRLKQYSFKLEEMGDEYKPVAQQLRRLVEAFEEDKIMDLIKKHTAK